MRVLFLTHRVPYAPNRGDRIRAFHILRTLSRSFELEIVSLAHDARELAEAERLRRSGLQITAMQLSRARNHANAVLHLAGRRPLTHVLLDAPGMRPLFEEIVSRRPPDVVLAYCSSMARFALQPPLSSIPLVVDLVDVDSQKWLALSQSAAAPQRWIYAREAEHLAEFERVIARKAVATLVVNERERQAMLGLAPDAQVTVVPVGVDLDELTPPSPPVEAARVVFCGVMGYAPNVEGIEWFCRSVWPAVRARRPDARFFVVGSDPAAAVRRLHSPANGIEVTGTVDDVRPYLWRSAVAVAPLLTARGVQTKVLEAIGAGLPAVVTPQVVEGLPKAVGAACRVGGSPEGFATELLSLLDLRAEDRRRLAMSSALETLTWESQLRSLREILTAAAGSAAMA